MTDLTFGDFIKPHMFINNNYSVWECQLYSYFPKDLYNIILDYTFGSNIKESVGQIIKNKIEKFGYKINNYILLEAEDLFYTHNCQCFCNFYDGKIINYNKYEEVYLSPSFIDYDVLFGAYHINDIHKLFRAKYVEELNALILSIIIPINEKKIFKLIISVKEIMQQLYELYSYNYVNYFLNIKKCDQSDKYILMLWEHESRIKIFADLIINWEDRLSYLNNQDMDIFSGASDYWDKINKQIYYMRGTQTSNIHDVIPDYEKYLIELKEEGNTLISINCHVASDFLIPFFNLSYGEFHGSFTCDKCQEKNK